MDSGLDPEPSWGLANGSFGVVAMIVICGKCRLQNQIPDDSKETEIKCRSCSTELVIPSTREQFYLDEAITSKPIWYLKIGRKDSGPVSWKSIEFLVESGKLTSEDTIWTNDDPQPRKISEIPSLKEKIDEYYENADENATTTGRKLVNKRLEGIPWWFLDEDGEHGPFSTNSFKSLIKNRKIPKSAFVRCEGLKRWISLSEGIEILAGRKRVESLIEQRALKFDLSQMETGLFYRNEEGSRGPLCMEDFIEILKTEDIHAEDEIWFDHESGWITLEDWLSQIDPEHTVHKILKDRSYSELASHDDENGSIESQCPHCQEITEMERSLLNHWKLCNSCHNPYRIREYSETRRKKRSQVAATEVLGIFALPVRILLAVIDFVHYYLEGISRDSIDLFLKNGILFILIGLYCFYHFWFSDPTKMDSPDRVFEEKEILAVGMISILIGLVLWTAPKS